MASEPNPGDLITCETFAAIVVHIRRVGLSGPHYGGGTAEHMGQTLCGVVPSWDTRIPVTAATCRGCRREFTLLTASGRS